MTVLVHLGDVVQAGDNIPSDRAVIVGPTDRPTSTRPSGTIDRVEVRLCRRTPAQRGRARSIEVSVDSYTTGGAPTRHAGTADNRGAAGDPAGGAGRDRSSGPVASVLPILDLEGVRDELRERVGPTVAVTPVVRSVAPSRPPEAFRHDIRERFLASRGVEHTAEAIAGVYCGVLDGFVGDARDGVDGSGLTNRSRTPPAITLVDTPPAQAVLVPSWPWRSWRSAG